MTFDKQDTLGKSFKFRKSCFSKRKNVVFFISFGIINFNLYVVVGTCQPSQILERKIKMQRSIGSAAFNNKIDYPIFINVKRHIIGI